MASTGDVVIKRNAEQVSHLEDSTRWHRLEGVPSHRLGFYATFEPQSELRIHDGPQIRQSELSLRARGRRYSLANVSKIFTRALWMPTATLHQMNDPPESSSAKLRQIMDIVREIGGPKSWIQNMN